MRRALASLAAVATGLFVATAAASTAANSADAPSAERQSASVGTTNVGGPTVVAVGDIACKPGDPVTPLRCQQDATAALAQTYDPRYVLGLGDLQYETGALTAFANSYDKSWGALKQVTRPVPGNHEYRTPEARDYYTYFEDQVSRAEGYYAFDVGSWRVYALNSNCTLIDCARQARWLNRQMTNTPRSCSAIMLHHPLFSSGGEHGNSSEGRRFWNVAYRHGADLALSGHDHDYERFRRMNPSGDPDLNGLFQFVAGTGGKSLYSFGSTVQGSLARDNHAAGVLALTLGEEQFAYEYKTIDGETVDSGVRDCR